MQLSLRVVSAVPQAPPPAVGREDRGRRINERGPLESAGSFRLPAQPALTSNAGILTQSARPKDSDSGYEEARHRAQSTEHSSPRGAVAGWRTGPRPLASESEEFFVETCSRPVSRGLLQQSAPAFWAQSS